MEYVDAAQILSHYIFEDEKQGLIKKIATNPARYIGVFRPTKPETKLIQNLLQSHEIRFGDALEYLFRELIKDFGFKNLDRELITNDEKTLSLDQYFTNGKQYFFMEQKARDDHDSTKKQGQVKNFEAKLSFLYKAHQENLTGIFYFVDPKLSKNKNYYNKEINKLMKSYNIELHLLYGREFFDFFDHSNLWEELIGWIQKWKEELPVFPEINFDFNPHVSFEEIKTLAPIYWKKIIANEDIWNDGIIQVLFSDGTTLKLLFGYFSRQNTPEYNEIAKALMEKINKYYY